MGGSTEKVRGQRELDWVFVDLEKADDRMLRGAVVWSRWRNI